MAAWPRQVPSLSLVPQGREREVIQTRGWSFRLLFWWSCTCSPAALPVQIMNHSCDYTIQVFKNVAVPKAQNMLSFLCKLFCSHVVTLTVSMLTAIDLNHQTVFRAGEIDDVWTDGMLSSKFCAQLTVPQTQPYLVFRTGHLAAKMPRRSCRTLVRSKECFGHV